MKIHSITFQGIPKNYAKINNTVSRSAQPSKEDFVWLKEHGITDIINFRTMYVSAVDFDEKTVVENLGMKYHNIPSITKNPKDENVLEFINLAKNIEENGGKLHIHCKAGADRTGMYSYIYKSIKGIGNRTDNQKEMLKMGHNTKLYPDLLPWVNNFIDKLLNKK